MYLESSVLRRTPFNITSNPKLFYESSSHKEAMAALLYGIKERKGIILLTGEVGTGKTTLCKTLLNRLPEKIKTSLIINPYFSEVSLVRAIAQDFGIEAEKKSRLSITNELNSFLVNINLDGGNAVLIIDEAQNLASRQLEQIRLFSNLETAEDKLLQIILAGQPELEEKLNQVNLRQIRQRIFVKYNISPLREEEVKEYIEFRLNETDETEVSISQECFKLIYEFSGGIPRLINMLCDRVLLLGFVKGKMSFNEEDFNVCIEELR